MEQYIYGVRATITDDKFKNQMAAADKQRVEEAIKSTQEWLDRNEHAEKDEYEAKQKEVEGVCAPIMTKVYQGSGGGGFQAPAADAGNGTSSSRKGPVVEEVD